MRSAAVVFLALLLVTLAALASCSGHDSTGPAGGSRAGTVTLRLVSPNGPEGAAVIDLASGPVLSVDADGDVVDVVSAGGRTRVVMLRNPAGELRARVSMSDTTQALNPSVVEVADSLNVLRTSLSGYAVDVVR